MSKPKNRNAERIRNGKQPHNICKTAKNKPFIGNNVFTTEDIEIVKRFTDAHPKDWTLQEIKDILPNTHTLKNVSNFLLRMFPQQVIDEHAAMPQPVRETAKTENTPEDTETKRPKKTTKEELARMRVDCWIQQFFPYLGPSYPTYSGTIRRLEGIEISNDEVITRAAELGVSYVEPMWTAAEDELAIDCKVDLLTDGNVGWHIYTDIFDTKRSKYQVLKRISLLEHMPPAPENGQDDDAIDGATIEKENDTMTNSTNTNNANATNHDKDRDDFRQLSDILMNLSPDVTLHVDIKFPDGMAIRFDREAKGGN